jgi:hypothetical protein
LRKSTKGKTTHLSKEHKAITYALSLMVSGTQEGTVPLSIFPVRNLNKTNHYENHPMYFLTEWQNELIIRHRVQGISFAYILLKVWFFMESGIPPVKLLKLKSLQDQ